MMFKPMNKVIKPFLLLAYVAVAAFSTNVSAALVLDFSTGDAGAGGAISSDGTNVTGTDILIGNLLVTGSDASDGNYHTDALLNFSTGGVAGNFITITGTVDSLDGTAGGIVGPLDKELLSGSFIDWDYGVSPFGGVEWFSGGGLDTKSCELLCNLGLNEFTEFEFFGFTLEAANGEVTSTDIINTAVPVPAAVWLFGTGLLGLVGVARRRV